MGDREAVRLSCHHGYAQLDSSCAISEGKAIFFAALLEDESLDDPNHAYYKGLSAIDNQVTPGVNLELQHTIAGNKRFRVSPFYRHSDVASLLWDLYDNTPKESIGGSRGTETLQLSLNDLMNSLVFAKITSEYYSNLVSALVPIVVNKVLLDSVFAGCIDSNKNGDCASFEADDGLSAWTVTLP
jgi:hypothetical protein